jgi:hypothetical protein
MHLGTDRAAAQFVERVARAISDAGDAGGTQPVRRPRPTPRPRGSRPATRSRLRARARRHSEGL